MYENPYKIPNPESPVGFDSATITGAEIDQYFVLLVSRQVEHIDVDGEEIVHIHAVEHRQNNKVTIVHSDGRDGRQHIFAYLTGSDHGVHHMIKPPRIDSHLVQV